MGTLKVHPAAELLPPMAADEYAALLADVRANGVREPIVVLKGDGRLLDGRHRLKAAEEAGVECPRREVETDSPVGYVLSTLHRRNLTASQRSVIAAKALPMIEEEAKKRLVTSTGGKAPKPRSKQTEQAMANLPQAATSRDQAAKITGVSGRSVQDAKQVIKKAPALARKVESGEMTLNAAKREIKQAPRPASSSKPAAAQDALGRAITNPEVAADFDRAGEFRALANKVHAIKREVNEFGSTALGCEIGIQDCELHFKQITNRINDAAPYAVCKCGKKRGCTWCKGKGWLTKSVWDRVPKEDQR